MPRSHPLSLAVSLLAAAILLPCVAVAFGGAAGPAATCYVPSGPPTIQIAVNTPSCDIIEIAAGTYYEAVVINRSLAIIGQGQGQTIVDGSAANQVFYIGPSVDVSLTGLTIRNGFVNRGAGIRNRGQLTVTEATVSDNTASDWGGAILNEGTLTISGSAVNGNSAPNGAAGAILNAGQLTVQNSTLSGNSANLLGGAILNTDGGTLTLAGTTLSANTAGVDGGAIYNDGATVTVSNSTLADNAAADEGGGIFNYAGTVTISGGTLSSNSAANEGGGIFNHFAGAMATVNGTVLSGNSAVFGGGIYNDPDAVLALNSATLSGNTANNIGGGIYNEGDLTVIGATLSGNSAGNGVGGGILNFGELTLESSTIAGNSAGHGGGIINYATMTIASSTIAGNTSNFGGGIYNVAGLGTANIANSILSDNTAAAEGPDCWGTLVSQDYNLVEDTANCTFTGSTTYTITGQDPLLGTLQHNGGPTWTQALLEGSPALDAGSCPGATADQRGYNRPVDIEIVPNAADGCDIGSYELQGTSRVVYLPIVHLSP